MDRNAILIDLSIVGLQTTDTILTSGSAATVYELAGLHLSIYSTLGQDLESNLAACEGTGGASGRTARLMSGLGSNPASEDLPHRHPQRSGGTGRRRRRTRAIIGAWAGGLVRPGEMWAPGAFALVVRTLLELCAQSWAQKRHQRQRGSRAAESSADGRSRACFAALRSVRQLHDAL